MGFWACTRKLLLGDIDSILVLGVYFLSLLFFIGTSLSFHAHPTCSAGFWVFLGRWKFLASQQILFVSQRSPSVAK